MYSTNRQRQRSSLVASSVQLRLDYTVPGSNPGLPLFCKKFEENNCFVLMILLNLVQKNEHGLTAQW